MAKKIQKAISREEQEELQRILVQTDILDSTSRETRFRGPSCQKICQKRVKTLSQNHKVNV